MADLQRLTAQVKHNCNISDATYWGYYSICGLLMRMRELYRNEHRMMPWERIEQAKITPWIQEREALWQSLEGGELEKICINSSEIDPFDTASVQEEVAKENLVYGAGYSFFGKPTFFLAEAERVEKLSGFSVFYTSRELCRDLSTHPAMLLKDTIYIRREPLLTRLWTKFLELRGRRFGGALKEAFSHYGINRESPIDVVKERLIKISKDVTEILLYHEIAEARESFELNTWLDMISRCRDLKVEFYLRTLKDILSDTSEHGPLKKIIDDRNEGLLNFFIILSERVHRTAAPEIITAYQEFKTHGDWKRIDDIRYTVYQRVSGHYKSIITVWKDAESPDEVKRIVDDLSKKHGVQS